MLKDSLGATYRKVISLQAISTAAVVLLAWLLGGWAAAISAVCGGSVVVAGSVTYALIARQSRVMAVSGKTVLARHLLAEAAKVVVMLSLLFGAYASGWFAAAWLLAAMGVALIGHVVAMAFIK